MRNYWTLSLRRILLVALLPTAAGLVLTMTGFLWRQERASFIDNSRPTEAKIVSIEPVGGDIRVNFQYYDDAGVLHPHTELLDNSQEPALSAARILNVLFDRRAPGRYQIGTIVDVNHQANLAVALAVFGLLVLLFGVVNLIREVLKIRAINALFASGQIVQTQVRELTLRPGSPIGRFTYAFRGPDGRWYEGASPELPSAVLSGWPVGKTIWVVYDNANVRRTQPDVFGVLDAKKRVKDVSPKG